MKIAVVQSDVTYGHPNANASKVIDHLIHLAGRVDLAVFPECFLTGYAAGSAEEAKRIAIGRDHESLLAVRSEAERTGVSVVVGFAESDGSQLFNTVAFFVVGEPDRYYRKTHMPFIGFDRFASAGDELEVFETKLGNIGILICYDQRPSEPARVLALKGADLILLPTNWPEGAEVSANAVCVTRAAESKVWMAACNRVGLENGFRFIGQSKIISPTGQVLESADDEEATLIAEIDLGLARQKRTVIVPGEYELEVMGSRRPELYGSLASGV